MPEEPKTAPEEPAEPAQPAPKSQQEKEAEVGDFITRHVLEKDSVFFEG